MPELRKNPLTGRWVVIATERAKRPESFTQKDREATRPGAVCPFCEGNEKMTPPEISAVRPDGGKPDTPGWEVRIVPNLYKAFQESQTPGEPFLTNSLIETMPALGSHEVLIAGPKHSDNISRIPEEQFFLTFKAFRERYRVLMIKDEVKYVQFIINHGAKAGASLEHPHAQLFAIPLIPEIIERELKSSAKFDAGKGSCIFCEIIKEEISFNERVVNEENGYLTFCPFASMTPFEMTVMPMEHLPSFEIINDRELRGFTDALLSTLRLLDLSLNDPSYNLYLHSTPCREAFGYYHWHVEIIPKLSIAAGFELGTGIYINIVNPEEAASFLRLSLRNGKAARRTVNG